MTLEEIKNIFKSENIDAEIHKDGYLVINFPDPIKPIIWIDENQKLVRFRAVLLDRKEVEKLREEAYLELAANLNATFNFGQFNIKNPLGLLMDYSLPYEDGCIPDGIICLSAKKLTEIANSLQESYLDRKSLDRKMKKIISHA